MPARLLLLLSRLCLGLFGVEARGGVCPVSRTEGEGGRFFEAQDNGEFPVGVEREGVEGVLRALGSGRMQGEEAVQVGRRCSGHHAVHCTVDPASSQLPASLGNIRGWGRGGLSSLHH